MNTLTTLLFISCAVFAVALPDVTINFRADPNSCAGKQAYVNYLDAAGSMNTTTKAIFPFEVVSTPKSISMQSGWYGQFYFLSTDDTNNPDLSASTRFIFDLQNVYKDYINVLASSDFIGTIGVTAADGKTLKAVADDNNDYVCSIVAATTSPGFYGDQNQLCDPTTVGSYTVTVLCP